MHDEIGRFFGFRGFASDLTKMRQSEVELDRLARQDSLTGLANREALRRALDDALVGAAQEAPLLGIPARPRPVQGRQRHPRPPGRRTLLRLVSLAQRRGRRPRAGRRLGGDEFRSCCHRRHRKRICRSWRRRIIDSLSRPYTINGNVVSIGTSVGIVTSDYDDRTSDDLMRDADLALYAAKAAGKGMLPLSSRPEMHEAARQRQLMESDLRVALEKGQLGSSSSRASTHRARR